MKTLRLAALLLLAAWPAGADYKAQVLADSPVAYYRLGESSGATAFDTSGNSRDGTVQGTPTYAQAGGLKNDPSTAMKFTANTQFVELRTTGNGGTVFCPDTTNAFTVEAWIKFDTIPSGVGTLEMPIAKLNNDGAGNNGYALGAFNSQDKFFFSIYKNGASITPSINGGSAVVAGTWYHVVATATLYTNVSLYVDGVGVKTDGTFSDTGLSCSTQRVLAGRSDNSAVYNFLGVLDEVAIYNTALSAARIKAHYQVGIQQIRRRRAALDDLLTPPVMQFARGVVPQPWLIAALRGEP